MGAIDNFGPAHIAPVGGMPKSVPSNSRKGLDELAKLDATARLNV